MSSGHLVCEQINGFQHTPACDRVLDVCRDEAVVVCEALHGRAQSYPAAHARAVLWRWLCDCVSASACVSVPPS